MNKTCFMFSGQGSQKTGMGLSLFNCSKKVNEIFECASDIFNFNVFEHCVNEKYASKLTQTQFAQPTIVAVSLAALCVLNEHNVNFEAVVGHSLGSITALIAAKCVSLEDGFKIVKARAKSMQLCENNNSGIMCAVVGENLNEIENECKKANGYVVCANYNSSNQVVISGEDDAVMQVVQKLKSKMFKCVFLKVKAAFHSKLMNSAAKMFEKKLNSFNFKPPQKMFFSNVTGKQITPNDDIKKLLVKHIVSPVKFFQNLKELHQLNFNQFVELGPKATLCKMVKQTFCDVDTFNVCDEPSLNKTLKLISTN